MTAPRRHPRQALTARAVQHARPTGHVQRLADGGGLYLLVAPSGTKSWVLRTVVKGRRCDLGLGSTALVSLADARDEAARLRRMARAGGDPQAARRREHRRVPTFEEAARRVHADHAAGFRNEKHRKQWLSSLTPVFVAFGGRPVSDLASGDLLAALSPQWLARPETSRRVLQRVKLVLDWCRVQGYCTGDNPAIGLTKALPKHRASKAHHPALPYGELPDFLQALRVSDAGEVVRLAFE